MKNEMLNDNVIPMINYIYATIPENASNIEKVRYVYMQLGKIFSFDYRVMKDDSIIHAKVDYEKSEISRYKTCIQISDILNILLNNIDSNVTSKVINRSLGNKWYEVQHKAIECKIDDITIILDLTLDLFLIQSNRLTRHFGFETDANNTYDIISRLETAQMDKDLSINNGKYFDEHINDVVAKTNKKDYSSMGEKEIIDYKMNVINNELMVNFIGAHELLRHIQDILKKMFTPIELSHMKQFNFSYGENDELDLLSSFIYKHNDVICVYTLSNSFGLRLSSISQINNLMKYGWKTNSSSIHEYIKEEENKKSVSL